MKKPVLHIGCSSYNTTDWAGLFYPGGLPRSRWFSHYCQHFSTYELNVTFYKFPTVNSLQSWYGKTPYDFRFSVKAPRVITHFKKFNNCDSEIADFYATCREGLAYKLACVLFQLPPSFSYTDERLRLVLGSLDYSFRNVVEFRHESWWRPDVFDAMAAAGVTFVSVNYPNLPIDVVQTTSTGFIRMHGNPRLFYSEYATAELEDLYNDILAQDFKEVYLYFNNTASTAAIINAIEFKKMALKDDVL